MTTVELAQHLVGFSRVADLSSATPAQKQAIALVMTRAVGEYFNLAPVCHRRTTLSDYRPAAETVSVTLTSGSVTVTGTPFLARQRGCGILFPDGMWNEIVGPSTLLHPPSQATGTYSCTVYNDALAFDDFQIDRVVTDPEITTTDGTMFLLAPWSATGSRSVYRPTMLDLLAAGDGVPNRRHDGASWPSHYWTEYIGGSIAASGDAAFQFRFWPAPSQAYHVVFDAEILPDTYRASDVTSPATLPVPASNAERILVPLACGLLARSWVFDPEKGNRGDLLDDLAEAREAARGLTPIFGPSYQTIGTEAGW